jgi:hypothetical protein
MLSSRVHRPDTRLGKPKDSSTMILRHTLQYSITIDVALKADVVYKTKEILKKSAGDHKAVIYLGAKHGFAIIGDPTDPKHKGFGDQAEAQAVSWFS